MPVSCVGWVRGIATDLAQQVAPFAECGQPFCMGLPVKTIYALACCNPIEEVQLFGDSLI